MTPTEVAALMSSIVDDEIGVADNFFEFGNSLLALRLLAVVEERCGARIGLLELIRSPTPEELAELIAADTATRAR